MEMSIADLVTYLENDLAEFHARLKALPRLRAAKGILTRMENDCREHARRAAGISPRYLVPGTMRLAGILEAQARFKQRVSQAILRRPDHEALCRQLAEAEATVARLYRGIAAHLRTIETPETPIAGEFDRLAEEELRHRDAFLKAAEESPKS